MTSKGALDKRAKLKAVLLPGRTNLAADPVSVPDFGIVIGASSSGRLFEYAVITDGVAQVTAVCAFGRKVAVTSRGAWFVGFHICAADRRNDLFMFGP